MVEEVPQRFNVDGLELVSNLGIEKYAVFQSVASSGFDVQIFKQGKDPDSFIKIILSKVSRKYQVVNVLKTMPKNLFFAMTYNQLKDYMFTMVIDVLRFEIFKGLK